MFGEDVQDKNEKIGVTFDLWETLIFDKPELDLKRGRMRCEGVHNALEKIGVSLTLEEVMRGYEESAARFQEVWDQNREVSTLEQILALVELAGGNVDKIPTSGDEARALVDGYVEPLLSLPPRLDETVPSALEELSALGVRIGLVSNTGRAPGEALRRMLEKYDVIKYFDATIFSNEVGWRKPDARIFKEAIAKLGIVPERVIHVGDNPDADFRGAREAGFNAILFEPELSAPAWGPNSLFALSRRHIQPAAGVDPSYRIKSLKDVARFVNHLIDT